MAIHGHERAKEARENVHQDTNSASYGFACEIQQNVAYAVMLQCKFHYFVIMIACRYPLHSSESITIYGKLGFVHPIILAVIIISLNLL